jgi:glutamate/tyrosine decarboxylase-like PLP-dependent enzyme
MQITQILTKISHLIDEYQTSNILISPLPQHLPLLEKEGSQSEEVLLQYIEYYLQHSVKTYKPEFANRMWSGSNTPAIIGELITAITNTSACTTESAPVSVQMEKYMLDTMLDIVGFTGGEGQMTTGSSNANMIAMMVARNKVVENCKNNGLFGSAKLIAFVNADAHYSFDKAANVLGIGADNLIKVATNSLGEMDTAALETAIIEQKNKGNIPFFVAATLGTTVRGAYDNIEQIAALRDKYQFFLHGDGAWGGSAIMSHTLKSKFMQGIEKLDSFTMDFHKMLGTSLICNFLLINNTTQALTQTCALGDVSYIFREDSDLGLKSLQCGRRVDSLKWFLDWQYFGKKGFGKRVEKYYSLVSYAQSLVEKYPQLELISPQYSFNICFRFKGEDAVTQQVRDAMLENGQGILSLAYVHNKLVFRLLVANVHTSKESLDALFTTIITNGESYQ